MDSASLQTGAGIDLQLKAPTRERIEHAIRLDFPASNNETEYDIIVLWAYRTTSRKPTKISLFAFTYGMEAIIPIEIEVPTLRIEILEKANAEAITKDLDMINELREAGTVPIASYQQRLTNLYIMHVKPCAFRAEDLVLRKVFENTVDPRLANSNQIGRVHT